MKTQFREVIREHDDRGLRLLCAHYMALCGVFDFFSLRKSQMALFMAWHGG